MNLLSREEDGEKAGVEGERDKMRKKGVGTYMCRETAIPGCGRLVFWFLASVGGPLLSG